MIQENALLIASGYVGQQEVPKGSNWGAFVQKCLVLVGITFPAPWCMAFVYRCFSEAAAGIIPSVPNPVIKTGSVLACWNQTVSNRKIFRIEALSRPELVTPGMQGILKEGAATGHTFIVERTEVKEDVLYVHTIEGNSNTDGSREGYEVVRHMRRVDDPHLLGFIKYE